MTYGATMVNRPTKYHHSEPPSVLVAVLREAIIERQLVKIVWYEGANDWSGIEADVCGALAQPIAYATAAAAAVDAYAVDTERRWQRESLERRLLEAAGLAVTA